MDEIKKSIQGMKEEINKDMENLKNNQSKINKSMSQTNITIKSLLTPIAQQV
jgi:predicted  nucleic acid-binding Zn-ribbon protein